MTLKTITTEEADQLFNHVTDTKWRLMYSLMLHNGLRVGEMIRLKWSDFYDEILPKIRLIIRPETTKTKKQRLIPLHVKTRKLIQQLRLEKFEYDELPLNQFIFTNADKSNHMSIRHIQRMLNVHASIAFGHKINPHQLRHTYATNLMNVCNIRVVQELLGHKSLQSTQVYTHPTITDLDRAMRSI